MISLGVVMDRYFTIFRPATALLLILGSFRLLHAQDCPFRLTTDTDIYQSDFLPKFDLHGQVRSFREYILESDSMRVPETGKAFDFKRGDFHSFDRQGRPKLIYRFYPWTNMLYQMKKYLYDDERDPLDLKGGYTALRYKNGDSSSLTMIIKFSFDAKGRIISRVRQDMDDKYWKDLHYSYSPNGLQLVSGESSRRDRWESYFSPEHNSVVEKHFRSGAFRDSVIFEYNERGCPVRREALGDFEDHISRTAYHMTYEGNKVISSFSMPVGQLLFTQTYGENGLRLESKSYDEEGKLSGKTEYTYDKYGNPLREWDTIQNTGKVFRYKYDDRGNWILKELHRTTSRGEVQKSCYFRIIEYYD